MARTCSLILLPSPFYSFILSLVAFGMKLNGGIKALAGPYTPPLDFMRFVVLCFVLNQLHRSSCDVLNKNKKNCHVL